MKDYLSIVNDTILESGADLNTFDEDGDDFDMKGHDSLMYKFKTWVARAWQTIQQNAYDWQFMSEQAVVNIHPGIMFYSSSPIATTGLPDRIDLYDTNHAMIMQNVPIGRVQVLTGVFTDTQNFGYVDLTSAIGTPISYGLKPGGAYFYLSDAPSAAVSVRVAAGGNPLTVNSVYEVALTPGLETAPKCNVTVTKFDPEDSTYHLAGVTDNDALLLALLYINIEGLVARGDDWATFTEISNPKILPEWKTTEPKVVGKTLYLSARCTTSPIGGGAISPGAVVTQLTLTPVVGGVSGTPLIISDAGTVTASPYVDLGSGAVNEGIAIELTHTARAALAGLPPADSYEMQAVFSSLFLTSTNFRNLAYSDRGSKCYVHSWKSFDWGEEIDVDDFVESVAELDEKSFKLVTHELPSPGMEIKLPFVHWEIFRTRYNNTTIPPSQPQIITKDNTGRWRTYPAPNMPYTITFDYVRNPQQLMKWDDVPKNLPRDLIDIIMWRALIYYGEYDEQPSVVSRATRNYKDLLSRLELRFRDKFHFVPVRLG